MQNNISNWVLVVISIFLVTTNFWFFPNNILSWDVFGYYMYLPMTFIYNNWGLQDIEIVKQLIEKYNSSSTLYQAYVTSTGSWVMRYPMGMAVLYSPFFAIAHLLSGFTTYPQDGFSYPYQVAILSGGIFYSIVGFYFLRKVLLEFFNEKVTSLSLIIIFFGTNYFWHAGFHGSNAMAHNYLFSLYAILLWITIKWHKSFKFSTLLFGAVISGLIMLSRPSEMVCLFIPLLWQVGNKYTLLQKLRLFLTFKNQIAAFFLVLVFISMPQFLYWKIIAGKFIFNSYGDNPGEGFEFLNPFLLEVLFSFRKGWLLYTPVMIFAIVGIWLGLKRKVEFSLSVATFFIFNLYIVSSWSCWWYAESFSQRSLVQSYAIMSLPLAVFINYLFIEMHKLIKSSLLAVISLLVVFNLFQTWQFLEGLIHSSRMTKAAYASVFLKTAKPDNFEDLLMIDRTTINTDVLDTNKYHLTHVWTEDFENHEQSTEMFKSSGLKSMVLETSDSYSPAIQKKYQEITGKEHAFLKISMRVYSPGDSVLPSGALVAAIYHKNYSYGYKSLDLENISTIKPGWNDVSFYYLTPVIRNTSDKLKVYYWHRSNNIIYIDDLKAEVFEPKR